MLVSVYIDNFKSFNDFSLALKPVTVIVGNNGSGKSSLLQALDFLSSIVRDDFSTFLEQRQLTVENIRSKFSKKTKISSISAIIVSS